MASQNGWPMTADGCKGMFDCILSSTLCLCPLTNSNFKNYVREMRSEKISVTSLYKELLSIVMKVDFVSTGVQMLRWTLASLAMLQACRS